MGGTYSVDGVELPGRLKTSKAIGVDVLVDGERNLDEEVHDHETLGTDFEGQDLDGVRDEETRPGKRVGNGEDPDHSNDSLTGSLALLGFLLRRANCPDDKGHAHGSSSSDKERATTDFVAKKSAGDRDDKRKDGETAVKPELSVCVGNANGLVDISCVVRDETVARPLREETERSEEHKPVAVATCLKEVEVRRTLLVLEFETESLLDLGVFELNGGIVDVAIGVVLAEDSKGFFVPLLRDQPTWGFRDEPDESQLDDRGESLGKGGNTPAPVAVNALGAKSQPCTNDSTDIPETVVDSGDTSTVLRVAKLGQQQRRRELGEGVAETH